MPTHKQITVNSAVTDKGLGTAATNDLRNIYTKSPIYNDEVSNDGLREEYQEIVMDAVINDGGHTFGTFDTAYVDAPVLAEVKTGGGGLPASAFVPNPVSPGPGSMNANDQADPPDGYGETPNGQFGSGVGSELGPKSSSEKISSQKLGDYVLGKSSKE
jgi:hypothetical protein